MALLSHEDLDRQPDGIPHRVVGLTALFAVLLAILIAVIFLATSDVGRICAIALAVIAVPVLVMSLSNKADSERDRAHPSR